MARKSPISKRLKEARLAAKYSQKKLGIAAGIDEFVASARMNQYETGKHTPDFLVIKQIARVLNLPTAYFYTLEDELADLIKIFTELNSKKQRQLTAFIKKLAAN